MEKYLATIEFRYTDAPRIYEESSRAITKKITLGVFDTRDEANLIGNKALEVLESKFSLNPNYNIKERFSSNGGLFGCPKSLISNLGYLLTPFSFYAKKNNAYPSKLCFADKLSFCLTPRWLYLPMVNATGEIKEYLKNAKNGDGGKHWKPVTEQKEWHSQLSEYMRKWVYEHLDGGEDTWTNVNRNTK